ncbi:MAG: aldolase/citrate lyase family protein [Gemmatimonadaceae bacterium]|jgi:4-hydroxy-2-oxoheptanedioate aldolase|nr:aldolase/citrate lyase family protein [Gemmatimonadaceae bacterium]
MASPSLCARLADGHAVLGVLSPTRDPVLVELCGHLGVDFYMMDGEHGALSSADAETIARACDVVRVPALARVRSLDPKLILQFLDAGVQGIMLPGVTRADELHALVAAAKYPPEGRRGLGPVRAADYLLSGAPLGDVVRTANARTLLLPQIEDIAAVDAIDILVTVPGIDGFIIGPVDLSLSMGHVDEPHHPDVAAAIARVVTAVRAAGKLVGTVARTPEHARQLIAAGHRILLLPIGTVLRESLSRFLGVNRTSP